MRILFVVFSALLAATSCSTEEPAPSDVTPSTADADPADVADEDLLYPGDATETIAAATLSYQLTQGGTGDGETLRYGTHLCEHARLRGTTVIARIEPEIRPLTQGVPVCERDYSQSASEIPVTVLANVAGVPVPTQIRTTYVALGWNSGEIYDGATVLMTIREDQGEWIWLAWVPVEFGVDGSVTDDGPPAGNLPTTFAELTAELTDLNTDPIAKCGGEGPDETYGWPDYVRDPAVWYDSCRSGYVAPDAAGYPSRDAGN